MKFVVFFCLIAVAVAAPEGISKFIPILERTEKHDDRGQFSITYLTGDGTAVSERGVLKPTIDGKDFVLIKEGEIAYVGPDGITYSTKYVADHLGFRAVGDHLPKSVVA